jgi:putative copper resistance protein D
VSRNLTAVNGRWPIVATAVSAAVIAGVAAGIAVSGRAVPQLPEPATAVRIGLPLVRVALDVAAVAAVGLAVLELLLRGERDRDAQPVRRAASRAGVVVGAAWTICVVLLLWLQAAELSSQGLGLATGAAIDYVSTVSAGRTLLVTGGCAVVYALLNAVAMSQFRHGSRSPTVELPLIVALLGLLPLPITGHSATAPYRELAELSIGLHVAGAAVWAGGLACVCTLIAPRRAVLARTLPRFSRLAGVCLGVVAASGVTNAAVELARAPGASFPSVLVDTGYAWLVLGKAACLILLAGIGNRMRLRLLPAISAHRAAPLAWWIGTELTVMAVALGLAAALGRAPIS